METAAREAMAQGALLALLFQWNEDSKGMHADRVTVTLHIDGGVTFSEATYWSGDVALGGEGF